MSLRFTTVFGEALATFRRDRRLLLPIAGLTLFLPQFAQLLLVPPLPPSPAEPTQAAMQAWSQALSAWVASNGIFYLAAPALMLIGALTVIALYLDRTRPTVGGAFVRAASLLLRYILSSVLVALPLGALMLPALGVRALAVVMLVPIIYISARTMLIAPVLVAEAPIGAVAAIRRSWRLTRGHGWLLTGIYASVMLGGQLVGGVFVAMGQAFVSGGGTNPVIVALAGALAAACISCAALALALIETMVYRTLASNGT